MRKFDSRALYIPDRKRILLDQSQPKPKLRWNEAHEVDHSILPWHEDAMVRAVGLEPTLLSELDFESSASTNSTTPARHPSVSVV